jgi:5-methylcytosine-specific restriction enzyme A
MTLYQTTRWQRIRKYQLSIEPLCRVCSRPGREVDHIVPISAGGDKWDNGNLQTLCTRCHSQKTGIEQAGGTWQVTGADGYPGGNHWWNE